MTRKDAALLLKMAQRDGAATKKGEEKDLTAETQRTQSPSFVLPRKSAGRKEVGVNATRKHLREPRKLRSMVVQSSQSKIRTSKYKLRN
jgi:hypothetical protein